MRVMSVEVRQCRWCLEPFEATNPRREYCCAEHRKRHFSRARYADADGYGAELAAVRCCRCAAALPGSGLAVDRPGFPPELLGAPGHNFAVTLAFNVIGEAIHHPWRGCPDLFGERIDFGACWLIRVVG